MKTSLISKVPEPYRIINKLRLVFESIDPRLMRHGERVAYLAEKLYLSLPESNEQGCAELFILALLHDIGAYKTEEIDDMMRFETQNIWPHAVYGYLFLRMTTRLGESAEAILYHHAPWRSLKKTDSRFETFACILHLADRIDVLLEGGAPPTLPMLKTEAGSQFCPTLVDAFYRLNDGECGLVAPLLDGSYIADVERSLRALCISGDEIIEYLRMIVFAIDFRSPFTVTHTANTLAISAELGRLFQLPSEEQSALELGAFLHDIGKILVPVEILESPDKLSDAEMALMRAHVVKSEEIICGFVDEKVCRIAVRHHEKLNGGGYPRGLSAEELTLSERIVAVSDVLSALLNRRSYKEAFPRERALSIIRRMRDDGELCPVVCDMLFARYDDILLAATNYVDPIVTQYEELTRSYENLRVHIASLAL